jgi:hypothetical protein
MIARSFEKDPTNPPGGSVLRLSRATGNERRRRGGHLVS